MKNLLLTHRKTIYVLIVLLLIPLMLFVRFRSFPHTGTHDPWKAYSVLLIGGLDGMDGINGNSTAEVRQLLETAGFENVVGGDSQTVDLFTYDGIKTVRLTELDGLLETGDARNDPYMVNLKKYFEGRIGDKPAGVFYLPEEDDMNPGVLEQLLREKGLEYYFSEGESDGNILYWVFYIISLLLMTLLIPKTGRILFVIGSLLPLSGIVHFTFPLFILSALQMTGWAFISGWIGPVLKKHLNIGYPELRRDFLRYAALWLIFSLSGLFLTLITGVLEGSSSVTTFFLVGFLMQAMVLYLHYRFVKGRVHRQQHTLFFPVSMRWNPRPNRRLLFGGALLLLSLAVLPAMTAFFSSEGRGIQVEYPQPVSEGTRFEGFGWSGMSGFNSLVKNDGTLRNNTALQNGGELPNLADYLSHRAFQEGYFYGRKYGFPQPNEEIVLQVFEKEEIEVISHEKVVRMFTEKWYKDIITEASKNGVTRILLSQEGPSRVVRGEGKTKHISSYTVIGYIGTLVLLFPIAGILISKKLINQSSFSEKLQQKKGQKVA